MTAIDFIHAETGAVTVDWVVLTAAISVLGLVVGSTVAGGLGKQSANIQKQLLRDDIICLDFCDRSQPDEGDDG
ncbi:hypothetical protein [Jannaschia rubra]|uniref:hypothetical protein n=1 Tax=Jannaschia rubra TaxID=282197 RepID=UPI002493800E|nr:hypothetical protein [Jannaschia rubra]